MPNIIKNLNFFKNGFKKKSAFGGFGPEGFWMAHTIYLMDFGVPKMGFLVLVLGVIERGVHLYLKCLMGIRYNEVKTPILFILLFITSLFEAMDGYIRYFVNLHVYMFFFPNGTRTRNLPISIQGLITGCAAFMR